jgi:hypothetical protein
MPPPAAPSPFTVLIPNITVGMPFLRQGKPAQMFTLLRNKIIKDAGFDFLKTFGDMMRPKGFTTNTAGVSNTSRHKCGDAFDFNQAETRLVVVEEPRKGHMYFRSYLRCVKQDGTQGQKLSLPKSNSAPKFYCDFTTIAEALGWHRIRAQSGWQQVWKKREFWHYQMTEGYSYDEAIKLLYTNPHNVQLQPEVSEVRLNDRDDEAIFHVRRDVRQVQAQLHYLKLLQPLKEIDGAFGQKTETAVKAFQLQAGLPATGIADVATRRALLERVLA